MEINSSPNDTNTIESSSVQRFDLLSDAANFMHNFVKDGRRSLDIFTHTLTPELYCKDEIIGGISSLARRSAVSKVRILVRDTRPMHGTNHALATLARRLPTHIEIRKMIEDTEKADIAYFCVDTKNLVFFNSEAECQGFAREDARVESKHYTEQFNQLWQHNSKEDANLRLLSL